jgi:hypothetical protein
VSASSIACRYGRHHAFFGTIAQQDCSLHWRWANSQLRFPSSRTPIASSDGVSCCSSSTCLFRKARCRQQVIIATGRKLGLLPYRGWVSGEVYQPLHQHPNDRGRVRLRTKWFQERTGRTPNRRCSVSMAWPRSHSQVEPQVVRQMAAPAQTRTPITHRGSESLLESANESMAIRPLGRKRRTLFNDKTKEPTGLRAAFSCAAQPVRDGKRDTFAPDQSFAERFGA